MADLSSPCIKVCVLDPSSRICSGCGRTIQEISNWMNYSDTQRQLIRRELGGRMRLKAAAHSEKGKA